MLGDLKKFFRKMDIPEDPDVTNSADKFRKYPGYFAYLYFKLGRLKAMFNSSRDRHKVYDDFRP